MVTALHTLYSRTEACYRGTLCLVFCCEFVVGCWGDGECSSLVAPSYGKYFDLYLLLASLYATNNYHLERWAITDIISFPIVVFQKSVLTSELIKMTMFFFIQHERGYEEMTLLPSPKNCLIEKVLYKDAKNYFDVFLSTFHSLDFSLSPKVNQYFYQSFK